MAIRLAFALLLIAAAPAIGQQLPRSQPEAHGMSSARLARIDTLMQQYIDASRAAGIAVLVVRDGRVVKSGTYGWSDREAGRTLQLDALFRIASQTKAITSVAVMMLVEEGKVRLADPVERWIPNFAEMSVATEAGVVPARRAITIRDLLTHSAGLSYGTDALVRDAYRDAGLGPAAGQGWYLADKEEVVCETMDRLGTLPLVAQPGERWVYGYATDVLGCVVERASGLALDEFFSTRIFEPLQMRSSWFFVPPAERARLTTVYAFTDGELRRAAEGAIGQGAYVDGPRRNFAGGAGLVSTIEDYARFLQMLLNGGELDGARILSPHSVELMVNDHVGSIYGLAGLGFGLGFQIIEDPALAGRYSAPGSYGWGGAYATTYWVDPAERLVALIMTQTLPSGGLDAADRFRTMVYSAIMESTRTRRTID